MRFDQEYTIYLFIYLFIQGLWPFRKLLEFSSGNKSVYSFTKTHDIVCLTTRLPRRLNNQVLGGERRLEMIPLFTVQSSAWTIIHIAIFS